MIKMNPMSNKPIISVIVPTYNEELGIEEFYRRTKNVLNTLTNEFNHELIFVNDCSQDRTLDRLSKIAADDANVKVLSFSRNFGNQIAITAGIDIAKGDIAVIIDDDLQDPPEVITQFIEQWQKGYKVVYGVRPKRKGVNPLFKMTAKLFYRLLGKLSDTAIPADTGDFRLIDKSVIDVLKTMREENRYYRGMVSWVGFSQCGVEYINFAFNGLTSFTDKPLYFSSALGFVITLVTFILALRIIFRKLTDPLYSIPGWPSLTVIVLFFGGVQLLSIGVVGVYISKIYREVKDRPLYIIDKSINLDNQ